MEKKPRKYEELVEGLQDMFPTINLYQIDSQLDGEHVSVTLAEVESVRHVLRESLKKISTQMPDILLPGDCEELAHMLETALIGVLDLSALLHDVYLKDGAKFISPEALITIIALARLFEIFIRYAESVSRVGMFVCPTSKVWN